MDIIWKGTISWREQVNFQWDDDQVHFVLDQHFYSASSLKKQSADRHVVPLWHIILILSQPVIALSRETHKHWFNIKILLSSQVGHRLIYTPFDICYVVVIQKTWQTVMILSGKMQNLSKSNTCVTHKIDVLSLMTHKRVFFLSKWWNTIINLQPAFVRHIIWLECELSPFVASLTVVILK
jgi:hypothetical protein